MQSSLREMSTNDLAFMVADLARSIKPIPGDLLDGATKEVRETSEALQAATELRVRRSSELGNANLEVGISQKADTAAANAAASTGKDAPKAKAPDARKAVEEADRNLRGALEVEFARQRDFASACADAKSEWVPKAAEGVEKSVAAAVSAIDKAREAVLSVGRSRALESAVEHIGFSAKGWPRGALVAVEAPERLSGATENLIADLLTEVHGFDHNRRLQTNSSPDLDAIARGEFDDRLAPIHVPANRLPLSTGAGQ